jgi:hypothetical protein
VKNENRYLWIYLSLIFGIGWSIFVSCALFAKQLEPILGKLTMTHPLIIFVLNLPTLSGLTVCFLRGGTTSLSRMMSKLIPRKQDLCWFPILFAIFLLFGFSMRYGSLVLGIETPQITYDFSQMLLTALGNFIEEIGLLGGVFGWAGFLLPFFQKKFKSNVKSGLLTGFIFGLWVLPGYGISSVGETTSYLLYVLQLMSFLVFASYVFNATKGNLTLYMFAFWLVASGSHIQLYNFVMPIQVMEVLFFALMASILHFIFKFVRISYSLQMFPEFIQKNSGI